MVYSHDNLQVVVTFCEDKMSDQEKLFFACCSLEAIEYLASVQPVDVDTIRLIASVTLSVTPTPVLARRKPWAFEIIGRDILRRACEPAASHASEGKDKSAQDAQDTEDAVIR
jgi:hypothetical protein